MKIEIRDNVYSEFQYMLELLNKGGQPVFDSPEALINFVLYSVADGSRRPGSWERGMLESMGLVADCPEHHQYRPQIGKPD